ncbi:sperm microtubule associated protein 2 isoform X2 [Dipodomys merriami]|uniref:sperm microtubule associated protein 2 isoform X2 n=1 Tax=Dipodomys merriami TaxID=94247 RepID=UPI0038560819
MSGSRAEGSQGTLSMGECQLSLPTDTTSQSTKSEDAPVESPSAFSESQWLSEPRTQSPDGVELGTQHGSITKEEMVQEDLLPDVQSLIKALGQDREDDIPETSQLTITDKSVSLSRPRNRRQSRLYELSRPKTNWQSVTDRTTPIWPIPRPTLEYHPTDRLKELAVPKIRTNIWNMDMSEVLQVSRAAQTAVPSQRILHLAKPKVPAPVLEEWDPMPKPKTHVSNYRRLLQLAMPKAQWEQCIPDRSPRWEVLNGTKKAVASERILSLARPKVRKDLNEGYNPFRVSPASLVAHASPRIYELAIPKSVTKKV